MVRMIGRYIYRHKWLYLMSVVLIVVFDLALLVPTQVVQHLVDQLASQTLVREKALEELGILALATVVIYLSGATWNYLLFKGAIEFKFQLQEKAFEKLVSMRRVFYERFRSGDMLTRFSTDTEGLEDMVGYGFMIVVYAGGMFAFVIPTMFLISWEISFWSLLPLLVMLLLVTWIGTKQDVAVEENREAISSLNSSVLEAVEGVRVMRAYSRKKVQAMHFYEKTRALAREGDRIMLYQASYLPLIMVFLGCSTLLVLWLGAHDVETGQVSLGQVLALQLYLVSLVEPLMMLSDFILIYQTGKISFEKVEELISSGDDMEEDGTEEITDWQEIAFSNYSFAYPQAEKDSLTGISWRFQKGQTVGIVGKTGSGKTSLIRQFLRQYPLGRGEFSIDGRPVRDYKRSSIESLLGYVPQEQVLFSKSVRENILLGKRDASLEELHQAIALAAFTVDVQRMSEGIETTIGEHGVSVSGGQKQRISLARAFLRQADILLLDDALSAVDAKTEQAILGNLQRERQGKTTVIVSHRLSAVHQADWILVMENGRIVEEGSPRELLAAKGWYYQQYQLQQEEKGEKG